MKIKQHLSIWSVLLTALFGTAHAFASTTSYAPFETAGSLIKNHDGDTIKLQTKDRGVLTVRFSGSDTPETGQAYWKVSRDTLRELLINKKVSVACYKKDRHERHVCHVSVETKDIGVEMVRQGMAWYAYQFANELTEVQRRAYVESESEARGKRLGLWKEPNPQSPWECRKLKKEHRHCR
jgi:endonuclease YncB( thermonuclease family)